MRPGIVHRLDKDTSGLLMVAKDDETHKALSEQLSARTMEKHYYAVVSGVMKEQQGVIDAPIARSKKDRKKILRFFYNFFFINLLTNAVFCGILLNVNRREKNTAHRHRFKSAESQKNIYI